MDALEKSGGAFEETGSARELAELNLLYAEYVRARETEQTRHAVAVALLDTVVSRLLADYMEALTSSATAMAASAVVSIAKPVIEQIATMHAELVTMHAELKEQYDLLMKTRAQGNNTRMIADYNTQRVDELEKLNEQEHPDE